MLKTANFAVVMVWLGRGIDCWLEGIFHKSKIAKLQPCVTASLDELVSRIMRDKIAMREAREVVGLVKRNPIPSSH